MAKFVRDSELRELQKDVRTGIYFVRKRLKGKPELLKSTGTRSRTHARKIALEELSRYMAGDAPDPKRIWSFRDIAQKWFFLKERRAKSTKDIYENRLRLHLGPYFDHMPISEITENTWEQYIVDSLKEKKRTIADDAKVMMGVMKYAFVEGLLPKKVRIRNPDPPTDEGIAYTEEDIFKLLAAASTEDMRLQIQIGYTMGMRHGEIAHLRWDWIDFDKAVIRLPKEETKTRRGRVVPINEEVLGDLLKRSKASKGPCVFPYSKDPTKPIPDFDSQWQRTWKRAGVPGRFHYLRHTCMTNMAASGVPESTIMMIVGCSPRTMRKVYVHLKSDIAANAVNLERGHAGAK